MIQVEQEAGERLAHMVAYPEEIQENIQDYMELTSQYGISRLRPPEHLHGLSFREAGLAGAREKYGVAVLAVRRGRDLVLTPDPEDRIQSGDVLVVAGRDEILARLIAPPEPEKS